MRLGRAPHETRLAWASYILGATLTGSALAIGSLHTSVLTVSAIAAAVACALAWWDAPPAPMRTAAGVLVCTATLLTAYTALQLVPMPLGVLSRLSPDAADTWARALSPLREDGPAWAPISLDPIATRVQVLRGLTYLAVLLAALRIAHTREGVAFLERALVLAGFSMAIAAAVHPALGAERVFGAYKPEATYAYDTQHVSPLLNTNHLAGFVDIALMVAVASALSARGAIPRPIAIAVSVIFIGINLWCHSRGALAGMVLGVIAVFLLARAARKAERAAMFGRMIVAAMVLAGGAMIFIGATETTARDYTGKDFSKLVLFQNVATKLVPRFWGTGLGRGAFESVFPVAREGTDYWVFTNPENFVLQLTSEWGVPVAILAMAAIAWALLPRSVFARSQPPIGAWAALAAAAVHNLVDYNAEVPGIAISLVTCAALVTGGSAGQREPGTSRLARAMRWLPFAVLPLVVVTGGLAVWSSSEELYNERRAFERLAVDRATTRDDFHARAHDAMLRHPAEPYLPFAGELRATLARDESPLPWAERALERSPIYGRAHLLLARAFYSRSPAQARLEYRVAYAQDAFLQTPVAQESSGLVRNYDDAMEIVPDGLVGLVMLEALSAKLHDTLPATSERLDVEIVRRDPHASGPVERAARATLSDLKNHESWCDPRKACLDEGLALARRVREARPTECTGYALVADFDLEAGDAKGAMEEMRLGTDRVVDRLDCIRAQLDVAMRTGESARIERAVDMLAKASCASHDECANNLVLAASNEASRGNRGRALMYYKKARETAPDRDDVLESLAETASGVGMHGEALDAYTALAQKHPTEGRWSEAAATERTAIQQNAAQLEPAPSAP